MRIFRSFLRKAGGLQPFRYGPRTVAVKRRRPEVTALAAAGLLVAAVAASIPVPAAAEPVRILAFGDSLTAGYGLPAEQGFVARLQQAIDKAGLSARVLDGGVSGDTTAGGLARLDWSLADQPDAVILELGANDGLRGLDPAATRENLDAMLAKLTAAGKKVLLAGMLAPPNLGPEYGEEFNRIYPELAEAHGVLFYPFFLDGVAADPMLNQGDGIHPNEAGVRRIVEGMMPEVRRLIEQARAGASAG
jgi:acyl-CoA thioesterase-1